MNHWLRGVLVACSLVMMGDRALLAVEPTPSTQSATAESTATAEQPFVGIVTGSKVNVRAGGNPNFEIVHQVSRGEPLLVVRRQGDWYAIELPPEAACFIASTWVARDGASSGHVTGANVNVRGGPGTKYNALGKISAGDQVAILGEHEGWLRIVPPSMARGWIAAAYVQPDPSGTPETVRAAYHARSAALATNPATAMPPTGARMAGGIAARIGAPSAHGRLERARGFWKRPGTHQLIRDRHTVAYLTSQAIALNDYVHQEVSVWGAAADPAGDLPVITVTHLVAAAQTSAGTPPPASSQ